MNHAIILAAGKGTRMHSPINKLLMLLNKEPLLGHTLQAFEDSSFIDTITIVANEENLGEIQYLIDKKQLSKVTGLVKGGENRQDSAYEGIKAIKAEPSDIVLIHNGANPFIDDNLIGRVIMAAGESGAAAAGFRAADTVKEADDKGFVIKTLDRNRLWHMQTPQAARFDLMTQAMVHAYNEQYYGTDDMELIEKIGAKVKLIECSKENFKITNPIDMENARLVIQADRIGFGQDSHKFDINPKRLILGGVEIPNENGLEANSDGDVILHALFNAISTAVGGKSLGFYADPLCRQGIKTSRVYLEVALGMAKEKGFAVSNIAVMVEGKKPRLFSYEGRIKANIARLCLLNEEQVGIAATSGEELTAWGKGEGLQCFCAVLLKKRENAREAK
ncbi:2-C-methyl-D-erythritol 4-phosphate cytidylyltransferase [Candidatus Woesearchaeota archaeon]|nr:2-C-methyl-D-erythritol 4-phosphate cytidylyltransferase [Candidatus Woesearchaeota archaeon]